MPFGVGFIPWVNVKYRPGRPILLFTHFVFSAGGMPSRLDRQRQLSSAKGITIGVGWAVMQLSSARESRLQ
jgi:hypothetical protein